MKRKEPVFKEIVIEKLVHGGQGIGVIDDGRKAFIWNALPGETVSARLTKQKKDFVEGVAEEILHPAEERITPRESMYLATSPWQNMTLDAEHDAMKQIVRETFEREGVALSKFEVVSDGKEFEYRNKIEFSFFGDDEGLHYAFYNRGTHHKQIINSSALAMPVINDVAQAFLQELNKNNVRAGDLKSVIFRCTQAGEVVGALFVKPTEFPKLSLSDGLRGLRVYHSNPKSPASVATKLLFEIGETALSDRLLGEELCYDVTGFFQVNLPVFDLALRRIDYFTGGAKNKIDMYAGVGSIGIPIGMTNTLVELDPANVAMARKNVSYRPIEVVQASTEEALEYITNDTALIVDPPRSGLHKDVIARIREVQPIQVCYLSCNPATQARDTALLSDLYKIRAFDCYNFFPRTPHIETLIILVKK